MAESAQRLDDNQGNPRKGGTKGPCLIEQQVAEKPREEHIAEVLDRQNVHNYFRGLGPPPETAGLAAKAIDRQGTTTRTSPHGRGTNPPSQDPLQVPETPRSAPKLSQEQQREAEMRARREQLQRKMDYLRVQIRGESSAEGLSSEVKDVLSREEHQQKIREIQAEKAELLRKHKQIAEQAEKRRKQQEQRQAELRALQEEREKERRRRSIEEKMRRRQQQHERLMQQEKQLSRKLTVILNKEHLYQRMEQRYNSEVMLPSLEERKGKLKQLRDFHRQFDLTSIRQHQRNYLALQQQRHAKQANPSPDKQPEQQDSDRGGSPPRGWQPPNHSAKMTRLLAEQAEERRQQLVSRKAHNEEMHRRVELFERQSLAKHRPRVDPAKKEEILQRYAAEEQKQQKPSVDLRRIGDHYMQVAKRMRRADSHREQAKTDPTIRESQNQPQKSGQHNLLLSRAHNRSEDFYEGVRRKRIDDILNSEDNTQDKLHLLRQEDLKLSERIRHKEQLARLGNDQDDKIDAGELLLTSIQAKMGLMALLRGSKPIQD